jgi:octanoyl-[GcvH]:protein N-octanoyltransferase
MRGKGQNCVSEAFPGAFRLINDTAVPGPAPGDYAAWVKDKLTTLQPGDAGILRLRRPRPTAAFSPQDTTHPDYERIREQARSNGFEPIERGTGGRLTMFDEQALAITLIFPHAEPHAHTIRRYEIFSGAIAAALRKLGIDAQVGELQNEYCPGKFSINAEGRVKLVGIAQRMNRRCVQMGAIIAVARSDKACDAIAEAYQSMGLAFDPATYGAISELNSTVSYEQVCAAMAGSIGEAIGT